MSRGLSKAEEDERWGQRILGDEVACMWLLKLQVTEGACLLHVMQILRFINLIVKASHELKRITFLVPSVDIRVNLDYMRPGTPALRTALSSLGTHTPQHTMASSSVLFP